MKKTLIALAAVAAVGAASAQVTVYGKADVGFKQVTGASTVIQSSGYEGSRIGVKGEKDLGGGMKGSFQLEKSISVSDGQAGNWLGANSFFDRVGTVGISGGFGTVTAGLQWSPYDNAFWTADALEYNGPSANNSVFYSGVHGDNGNTGWGNVKNSIQYATPVMSGFQAFIMTAPNQAAGSTFINYTGLGLNYANGPLTVNFAQESMQATAGAVTQTGWILGGNYNLGSFAIYVAAEAGDSGAAKDVGGGFGVKIPMGQSAVMLGFATETSTVNGAALGSTVSGFAGQYIYNLNKSAVAYAGYGSKMTVAATANAPTVTTNTLTGGVRYDF